MNNTELFQNLPFMVDDERAVIYKLSFTPRVALLGIYVVCGIWGSVMKFFLFYNLMQEKFSERPINILIFIDHLVDYIGNIVIVINTSIKVATFFHFLIPFHYFDAK